MYVLTPGPEAVVTLLLMSCQSSMAVISWGFCSGISAPIVCSDTDDWWVFWRQHSKARVSTNLIIVYFLSQIDCFLRWKVPKYTGLSCDSSLLNVHQLSSFWYILLQPPCMSRWMFQIITFAAIKESFTSLPFSVTIVTCTVRFDL